MLMRVVARVPVILAWQWWGCKGASLPASRPAMNNYILFMLVEAPLKYRGNVESKGCLLSFTTKCIERTLQDYQFAIFELGKFLLLEKRKVKAIDGFRSFPFVAWHVQLSGYTSTWPATSGEHRHSFRWGCLLPGEEKKLVRGQEKSESMR